MIINTEYVNDTVRRFKRARINPDALDKKIGEVNRSKHISASQRQQRFHALLDQGNDPLTARTVLERIIGGNDLTGVNYLAIGSARARAVCRIHLRDGNGSTVGFGTGFLVGPGILMTNHHVIADAEGARNSLAEFDYEYDAAGIDKAIAPFALLTDPPPLSSKQLDFCLIAVSPKSVDGRRSLEEFGWLPLNGARGKAIIGEYLTIIQHPNGERKQVCVRENKLLKYDENGAAIWYKTDTVAGSSGSPVFNESWQVVALHHSGVPDKKGNGQWLTVDGKVWDSSMDETRVKWIANEGIRISSIVEYLQTAGSPLAMAILRPSPSPVPEQAVIGGRLPKDSARPEIVDDELQITIPIRVRIGTGAIGTPALPVRVAAAAPISARIPQPEPRTVIEAVIIDQSNYASRPGYNPDFLGKGKLSIPLPKVGDPALKRQLITFQAGNKPTSELKYWNYSIIMNKGRKLAFVSAANADPSQRPPSAGREGDRWYTDTRIDTKFQLGSEFYGAQRDLEADRSQTPFDRGHLTRRLDAQWGKTAAIAQRSGNDSFHWTNCSPQHYRFNQGAKRWLGLEDYVIQKFAGDSESKASVFSGPVFDAPLSKRDAEEHVIPDLKGKRHVDPLFGDVSIPKMFFKIVAWKGPDGDLSAAGFLMSQEDLLATTDRIKGMPQLPEEKLTDAEAKLYQVSISDLAELTGLDFGPLAKADKVADEVLEKNGPRPIESIEQIDLGI